MKDWIKLMWTCGCGRLNAGWLNKCGKCQKKKKEKNSRIGY